MLSNFFKPRLGSLQTILSHMKLFFHRFFFLIMSVFSSDWAFSEPSSMDTRGASLLHAITSVFIFDFSFLLSFAITGWIWFKFHYFQSPLNFWSLFLSFSYSRETLDPSSRWFYRWFPSFFHHLVHAFFKVSEPQLHSFSRCDSSGFLNCNLHHNGF